MDPRLVYLACAILAFFGLTVGAGVTWRKEYTEGEMVLAAVAAAVFAAVWPCVILGLIGVALVRCGRALTLARRARAARKDS